MKETYTGPVLELSEGRVGGDFFDFSKFCMRRLVSLCC